LSISVLKLATPVQGLSARIAVLLRVDVKYSGGRECRDVAKAGDVEDSRSYVARAPGRSRGRAPGEAEAPQEDGTMPQRKKAAMRPSKRQRSATAAVKRGTTLLQSDVRRRPESRMAPSKKAERRHARPGAGIKRARGVMAKKTSR
jgi:hypothetical protein